MVNWRSWRTVANITFRCALVIVFYALPIFYLAETQQASEELLKRATLKYAVWQKSWKQVQLVWLQSKFIQTWCQDVHIVTGAICALATLIGFVRDGRYASFITGWLISASACVALYHTKEFTHIHISMISLSMHVLVCRWIAKEMQSAFTSGFLHWCSDLFILTLLINLAAFLDLGSIGIACGVMYASDKVFRICRSGDRSCYECVPPLD